MAVSINVVIVDWARVEEAPPETRLGLLEDAVYPPADMYVERPERGWSWSSTSGAPWFAEYAFEGTLGLLKYHFYAGEAWERIRGSVDPALRAPLDAFMTGLFWDGPDGEAVQVDEEVFPAGTDLLEVPLARTPESVTALARSWAGVAPLLDGLRAPFAVHAARLDEWMPDFEVFARLLRSWAEIIGEADRRGWGVVGFT